MKALYDIIHDCTEAGTKQDLTEIRDRLHSVYDKVEAAEDFMSMCGNADAYEGYYSVVNGLYEILYG